MNAPIPLRSPGTALAVGMLLSGTVGMFAVWSGQPTFNVVIVRCLFGAFALFGWAWMTGGVKVFDGLKGVDWRLLLASGVFLVLNWLALFEAFQRASIGFATIIYHLQPFWIVIAGSLFLRDRLTSQKLQWLLVGFAGLVLTVLPKVGAMQADPNWAIGLSLALLASILYAATTLTTRAVKGLRPEVLSGVHCLIGLVLFIPFLQPAALAGADMNAWGSLVVIGIVHTGVVYVLIYSAYPKLPIIVIGGAAFLNPAAALVADYVAFNQAISMPQALGLILILLAGIAINLGWRPPLRRFR